MGWKKKHWFSYPHQLVGHCWPNGSGDTTFESYKVGQKYFIFLIFLLKRFKKWLKFITFTHYNLWLALCHIKPQHRALLTTNTWKSKKNWPQLAKIGCKIMPIQQLQANNWRLTQEHIIKLPGMKKPVFQQSAPTGWTLSAQRFRRYNIFKLKSFCWKNQKMAQICHIYCLDLPLIVSVICPVSYHSAILGHIDKEYL